MIEFKDVRKIYKGGTAALDGVSFKINDGEFVFIVGESGAGKTTIIKLLLREEKATSGKITVGNYADISSLSNMRVPQYRRSLGIVFQEFRLFPTLTVYENVAFAMRVVGWSTHDINVKVPHLLKLMGVLDKKDRFPRELSGGEQQRVALARALANSPDIIIADEPTGNLDPKMSLEIMNTLLELNKFGKTVIVVTHEKGFVDTFRRRVLRLVDGKIVSDKVGGMFE